MRKLIEFFIGRKKNFIKKDTYYFLDEDTSLFLSHGILYLQNQYGIISIPISTELIDKSPLNQTSGPPEQLFSDKIISKLAEDYNSTEKERVKDYLRELDEGTLQRFLPLFEKKEEYEMCQTIREILEVKTDSSHNQ